MRMEKVHTFLKRTTYYNISNALSRYWMIVKWFGAGSMLGFLSPAVQCERSVLIEGGGNSSVGP
jgi:hypothetical protein